MENSASKACHKVLLGNSLLPKKPEFVGEMVMYNLSIYIHFYFKKNSI